MKTILIAIAILTIGCKKINPTLEDKIKKTWITYSNNNPNISFIANDEIKIKSDVINGPNNSYNYQVLNDQFIKIDTMQIKVTFSSDYMTWINGQTTTNFIIK